MESVGKIHFLNSPYPNGHSLKAFTWRGRIDEDESVWFDFHLKSEDYYAEEEDDDDFSDDDAPSSWDSKIVWDNYHACTLSSVYWGEGGGIRIDQSGDKVDFDRLIQNDLYTDDLPSDNDFDEEDLAFGIYLLGHDSCAGHRIKISKKENDLYDIE